MSPPAAAASDARRPQMCYHRLNIFTHCGHVCYSPIPLLPCPRASFPPESHWSDTCTPRAHPFQTLRVEGNCSSCERERAERLRTVFGGGEMRGEGGGGEAEEEEEGLVEKVRVEEWKWKVKYAAPKREGGSGTGKLEMDLGKEVAARREGDGVVGSEAAGSEGEGKRMSVVKKMVRWRWKRGTWRKSDGSRSSRSWSGSVKSPVDLKSPVNLKSPKWS